MRAGGRADTQKDRQTGRQDEAKSGYTQYFGMLLKTLQSSLEVISHIYAVPSELKPLFSASHTSSTATFLCDTT